jgi:hypothetical protein
MRKFLERHRKGFHYSVPRATNQAYSREAWVTAGLYGSFLAVNVYGGAQRDAFLVTPPKTPVSFRFARISNKTKA